MLGDLAVTQHRMGPVHARRGRAELMRAPAGHLTAMTLTEGRLDYLPEGGAPQSAGPGDVLLIDYARAFDYRTPGHAGATVSLPRVHVEDRLGPLAEHGLLPDTAEGRLFAGFLPALVGQLPTLRRSSALPVATIATRMVLLAIDPDARAATPVPGSLRARAQAYLDAQPPGSLDVRHMARALGLSRSRLYRLFAAEGGVRAYDRRRRLRLLHMALLETPRDVPLGALGARFGFLDLSALARQFRQQFGLSMSEVRDHLTSPAPNEAAAVPLERYRRAFAALSGPGAAR